MEGDRRAAAEKPAHEAGAALEPRLPARQSLLRFVQGPDVASDQLGQVALPLRLLGHRLDRGRLAGLATDVPARMLADQILEEDGHLVAESLELVAREELPHLGEELAFLL